MRKLGSASNVAVYGGGVKGPGFLGELSQMIGDYDRRTTSTSVGRCPRLEVLWRIWEHLRRDPATGASTWCATTLITT
ncbi:MULTISPECIES: hypothetical protein [unclassified Microbacterium]|uniref:hypothetical protein n=1 Tax=unclassified Microbacterium TaxID=2609290 RepID=UPI0030166484